MTVSRTVLALSFVAAATAPMVVGPMAVAQPKGEGRAQIVQELSDCRKISDNAERLACYDKTAASLEQAEAKGDIVVVDREQARKVRRQAFGFQMPSISLFEKGETQEELENVAGQVDSARQNSMGQWVIKLKDGAVWAQIDNNELHRSPKNGSVVKVRKASMGSFLMTIDNGGGFRVRRVE